MTPARSRLGAWLLACLVTTQASCSYLYIQKPQYTLPQPGEPSILAWPCDNSYAAPVVDTVLAALPASVTGLTIGSAVREGTSIDVTGLVLSLFSTAAYVVSAVYGYRTVHECRRVLPDVAGLLPLRPIPEPYQRERPQH